MQLPKKINLGCGNIILVKQVERTVIQGAIGEDTEACWLNECPNSTSAVGMILIDKTLSMAAKKEALYHEMMHAVVDVFQWAVDDTRRVK